MQAASVEIPENNAKTRPRIDSQKFKMFNLFDERNLNDSDSSNDREMLAENDQIMEDLYGTTEKRMEESSAPKLAPIPRKISVDSSSFSIESIRDARQPALHSARESSPKSVIPDVRVNLKKVINNLTCRHEREEDASPETFKVPTKFNPPKNQQRQSSKHLSANMSESEANSKKNAD